MVKQARNLVDWLPNIGGALDIFRMNKRSNFIAILFKVILHEPGYFRLLIIETMIEMNIHDESKTMKKIKILAFGVCILLYSACADTSMYNQLRNGFVNPPQEAKPLVWWDWLNGNVTKNGIKADLIDMKRAGIGGVQLFDLLLYMPEGPVRYGSDNWYQHVNYAVHIADSLGLEFHVMNCPGWSASGGPWNSPEKSMKRIVWSDTTVDGAIEQEVKLPFPEIKHDYFVEIAVFAVPAKFKCRTVDWEKKIGFSKTTLRREINSMNDDTISIPKNQVLNLSENLSDKGVLSCNLPDGRWTVIRFGFTTTGATNHPAVPEGHGLECDKLDAESVKFQFDNALGTIIENADPYLGKTFKGIVFDSFEAGFQNWTTNFLSEFERINGYDLLSYLPVLTGRIIDSKAVTEAILYDFRCTIDALLVENYFKTMQELAHKNGLVTYSESQGGALNPFLCNKYVDVPMNEFWLRNYTKRVHSMKQSAASANLYNKNIVAAESFTAIPQYGKWQNTPFTLKKAGDCAFSSGINRFIFHTYIHQPYDYLKPGFTMGRYGTHFGRQCSWWHYANGWVDYITKSQFLLQQGRTVTDIGILLSNDMRYDVPPDDITPPLGYDLTMCYPLHLENAKVIDGQIKLSQFAQCRVLVINNRSSYMSVETLKNIYRLVKEGAIIAGEVPRHPPGFLDLIDSLEQFYELVEKIWGGLEKPNTVKLLGKGKVLHSTDLNWIVNQIDITPDLEFVPNISEDSLRYIHSKIDDTDIYFVTNLTSEKQSVHVKTRVLGKKPEFWDAATGKMWDVPEYKVCERTEIPMTLESGESVFIVFSKVLPATWITRLAPNVLKCVDGQYLIQGKETIKISYSDGDSTDYYTKDCPKPIDLSEDWKVRFLEGRGAPDEPVIFEKLTSWTEHPNKGIKYYSGIAEYNKTFILPKDYLKNGRRCVLELGEIRDVAQITINEHKPVFVWQKPAEIDITDMLVKGENTVKIGVANRWMNRLIGDERIHTDIPYRAGDNKFTNGVIEKFPDWMRDEQRAKKENKRYTFSTWKHYTAESSLQESGLLGPVRLVVYNEFTNITKK